MENQLRDELLVLFKKFDSEITKISDDKIFIAKVRSEKISSNHLDEEYNVTSWNQDKLHTVLIEMLKGIWYFYSDLKEKKSFPIANYNNIKDVFQGHPILFINKKSIYRFPKAIQSNLRHSKLSD